MNCVQGIEAAGLLWKIEPPQVPGRKVSANHRLGHVAPTDAGQKQGMLGAQIGETPRLDTHHPEIAILGQC